MTKPANDEIENKLIQLLSIRGLCGQRQIEETLPFLKQLITSREKRVAEEMIKENKILEHKLNVIKISLAAQHTHNARIEYEYSQKIISLTDMLDEKTRQLEELRAKYLTEEPGKEGE